VLKHRYEILEKIGEGNLFTVYKAEDKIENRIVAVKILLSSYAADRLFAERLIVEARAMEGIAQQGLIGVFDCGEQNGQYFFIVEFVRGIDLKEKIRRSAPFALSTVTEVALSLCETLDYAHKKGFVHGDLRPGNILVTSEGQLKLGDFWVSGAVASAPSISANSVMRSIHYMAPEVAEGKPATPASDIYALGVILFQLLTGVVPYDGDTPIAIALQHAREPIPSLRQINTGIPKNMEAAVTRALQKDPNDRFRSAKAMLNEFKAVRESLNLSKSLTWNATVSKQAVVEPEDQYVEEEEPKLASILRRTFLAIVIILLVMVGLFAGYIAMKPNDIPVPDLVGKQLTDAQQIAMSDKFQIAVQTEQYNDTYPAGVIYLMNPNPGMTIKTGKTVSVWVSKGSKYATVPNLANTTREEAQKRVEAAGLVVGEVTDEYSATIPNGNVVRQTPAPGTKLERNQSVTLVFSLGPSSETQGANQDQTSQTPQAHQYDVSFDVPPGPSTQSIKITVVDDSGESEVYSEDLHPGDHVQQTVQGTGDKVRIRVYIDGNLVRDEPANEAKQ
jgi:serine/threonine-protein kinase